MPGPRERTNGKWKLEWCNQLAVNLLSGLSVSNSGNGLKREGLTETGKMETEPQISDYRSGRLDEPGDDYINVDEEQEGEEALFDVDDPR